MEALLLIKATLRIYFKSIKKTFEQSLHCWKYLLFHLLITLACLIASIFSRLIPGIVGGFILGIFLALAASCYLASIFATYSRERKSFKDLFFSGLSIFNPLLSVLFSLFIVHLLSNNAPSGLQLFIGLAVAIVFNPMPELVQLRPSGIMEMLSESLEFIRDNLVEWNLPYFLLIGVIYLLEPITARSLFYFFATINPVDLIQLFLLNLSSVSFFSPLTLISLVIFYLLFVFRLNLFYALSSTTHRKRIYSERNL